MKIIIPIAGNSDEFIDKFDTLKPLTKVGDTTVIDKFIGSFKFNLEYIFICRLEDILNTNLIEKLNSLKIKKKIIIIDHITNNIIDTILSADKYIKKKDAIIIAHPDSIIKFNRNHFLKQINNSIDGLIFTYNHFNPTFLDSDLVGRCIVDAEENVLQVKEKSQFNPKEQTLAGVYYYSNWNDFKIYAKQTFLNQSPINGMFYVSQIYNEYIKENKIIKNYRVKKFISLGLTKNIEEFNFWYEYSNILKKNKKNKILFNHVNLIPACGVGKRFADEGYDKIKPLIKIKNKTMLQSTIDSLPRSKKNTVIILREHQNKYDFVSKHRKMKNTNFLILDNKTDGMSRTCMKAKEMLDINQPLLISSCDYSVVFNENKFKSILDTVDPDVVIWTFKGYPDARIQPYAYAYIEENNGYVTNISEKIPISSTPNKDKVVQGIFYFKTAKLFYEASNIMFKNKNHVNGEYYIATSINELILRNKKVISFPVEKYICWGTPFDLKTYEYWISLYK